MEIALQQTTIRRIKQITSRGHQDGNFRSHSPKCDGWPRTFLIIIHWLSTTDPMGVWCSDAFSRMGCNELHNNVFLLYDLLKLQQNLFAFVSLVFKKFAKHNFLGLWTSKIHLNSKDFWTHSNIQKMLQNAGEYILNWFQSIALKFPLKIWFKKNVLLSP